MSLYILVNYDDVIAPIKDKIPLLEDMFRVFILFDRLGVEVRFYTSFSPDLIYSILIDFAPSIFSPANIFQLQCHNRELPIEQLYQAKYRVLQEGLDAYNKGDDVLVLDCDPGFIDYLKTAIIPFSGYLVNNANHSHLQKLNASYNLLLRIKKRVASELWCVKEESEQKLANDPELPRMLWEIQDIELHISIVDKLLSFLRELENSEAVNMVQLSTLCIDHLSTIRAPVIKQYEDLKRGYCSVPVRDGINGYKHAVFRQNLDGKFDKSEFLKAMEAYGKLLDEKLTNEREFLQKALGESLTAYYQKNSETLSEELEKKQTQYALYEDECNQKKQQLKVDYVRALNAEQIEIRNLDELSQGESDVAYQPCSQLTEQEFKWCREDKNGHGVVPEVRSNVMSEVGATSVENGDEPSKTNNPLYQSAFDACREGDLEKLKRAMKTKGKDFDVNLHDVKSQRTFLELACLNAHPDIVELLFQTSAKTNANLTMSDDPPIFSALRGMLSHPARLRSLNLLLQHGANMGNKTKCSGGNTPLHHAARQGNVGGVKILVKWIVEHPKECASINALNNDKNTPLLEAIFADRRGSRHLVIKTLLDNGACLRAEDIERLRKEGKLNLPGVKCCVEYFNEQARKILQAAQPSELTSRKLATSGDQRRSLSYVPPLSSPRARSGSHISTTFKPAGLRLNLEAISPTSPRGDQGQSPVRENVLLHRVSSLALPASPRRRASLPQDYSPRLSPTAVSSATAVAAASNVSSESATVAQSPGRARSNSIKAYIEKMLFSSKENSPREQAFAEQAVSSPRLAPNLLAAAKGRDSVEIKRILTDLTLRNRLNDAYVRDEMTLKTALQTSTLLADEASMRCFYDAGVCLSALDIETILYEIDHAPNTDGDLVRVVLGKVLSEISRNYVEDMPPSAPVPDSPVRSARRSSLLK